jgi:hypothetical protein
MRGLFLAVLGVVDPVVVHVGAVPRATYHYIDILCPSADVVLFTLSQPLFHHYSFPKLSSILYG